MKRYVWLLILLFVSLPGAAQPRSNEAFIRSKAAKIAVPSRFRPVLIYRDNGREFAGSGSIYASDQGAFIVTAEHLFDRGLAPFTYTYRLLQSKPPERADGSIAGVFQNGAQFGGADVVIVRVGAGQSIPGFSVHPLGQLENESGGLTPFQAKFSVTSLASGRKCWALGSVVYSQRVSYVLLDCPFVDGESGTGMVDDKDRLYVAKGTLNILPAHRDTVRKVFGTTALTIAFGPLGPG